METYEYGEIRGSGSFTIVVAIVVVLVIVIVAVAMWLLLRKDKGALPVNPLLSVINQVNPASPGGPTYAPLAPITPVDCETTADETNSATTSNNTTSRSSYDNDSISITVEPTTKRCSIDYSSDSTDSHEALWISTSDQGKFSKFKCPHYGYFSNPNEVATALTVLNGVLYLGVQCVDGSNTKVYTLDSTKKQPKWKDCKGDTIEEEILSMRFDHSNGESLRIVTASAIYVLEDGAIALVESGSYVAEATLDNGDRIIATSTNKVTYSGKRVKVGGKLTKGSSLIIPLEDEMYCVKMVEDNCNVAKVFNGDCLVTVVAEDVIALSSDGNGGMCWIDSGAMIWKYSDGNITKVKDASLFLDISKKVLLAYEDGTVYVINT